MVNKVQCNGALEELNTAGFRSEGLEVKSLHHHHCGRHDPLLLRSERNIHTARGKERREMFSFWTFETIQE